MWPAFALLPPRFLCAEKAGIPMMVERLVLGRPFRTRGTVIVPILHAAAGCDRQYGGGLFYGWIVPLGIAVAGRKTRRFIGVDGCDAPLSYYLECCPDLAGMLDKR